MVQNRLSNDYYPWFEKKLNKYTYVIQQIAGVGNPQPTPSELNSDYPWFVEKLWRCADTILEILGAPPLISNNRKDEIVRELPWFEAHLWKYQDYIQSVAGDPIAPYAVQPLSIPSYSPSVGQVFTATPGIYGGIPAPTVARQWQRRLGAGAWADVPGATDIYFIPSASDEGYTLRFIEVVSNSEGSISPSSAPSSPVIVNVVSNPPGPVNDLSVGLVTDTTVQLVFTDASGATSHEYKLGLGIWTALASNKIITGLNPVTAYTVRVRGVNATGSGPESSPVTFNTAAVSPTLVDLTWTLSAAPAEDAASGTLIGTYTGMTAGSTLSLTGADFAAGRVALASAGQVVVGAAGLTGVSSISFVPRETLAGAANTPHDSPQTTVTVSPVVAQAFASIGGNIGYGLTQNSGAVAQLLNGVAGTAILLPTPQSIVVQRPGYNVVAGVVQPTTWPVNLTAERRQYDIQASNSGSNTYLAADGSPSVVLNTFAYRDDIPPAGVTNNVVREIPVGKPAWTGPDIKLVGDTVTVGVTGASTMHMNRQPFAAVVFKIIDGETGTQIGTDFTVSNTTKKIYSTGHGIYEYKLVANLATLGVPDGKVIRVSADCYPWHGGPTKVIKSAPRLTTASTVNWAQFRDQFFLKHTVIFNNRPIIYVKASTGNDTTAAVGNPALPAATLRGALLKAQAWNNTNNGANVYNGAIIRLMENHTGVIGSSPAGTLNYYSCGDITIEADPATYTSPSRPDWILNAQQSITHTVLNTSAISATYSITLNSVQVIHATGATYVQAGGFMDFSTNSGIGTPQITLSNASRFCSSTGRIRFLDGSFTNGNFTGCSRYICAVTDYDAACTNVFGSKFAHSGVILTIPADNVIGSRFDSDIMYDLRDSGTTGQFGSNIPYHYIEANKILNFRGLPAAGLVPGAALWTETNTIVLMNNLFENCSTATNSNLWGYSGDGQRNSIYCLIEYGNTWATFSLAGRMNEAYSDRSNSVADPDDRHHVLLRRQCIYSVNAFKGAVHDKDDGLGLSGTAIMNGDGALPYGYGVDTPYNIAVWRDQFPRIYNGAGSVTSPVNNYTDAGLTASIAYVDPRYTTNLGGTMVQGAGFGDYRLGASSLYRTMVPADEDFLKCDIMGNDRLNGDAPGCYSIAASAA